MGCVTIGGLATTTGKFLIPKQATKENPSPSYFYLLHVHTVNVSGVDKALNVKFSNDNKAFSLR